MHFHFSFYSSILLIFFTQGLVFSFLLLKKGIDEDSNASQWLSLFVFLCCLYIAPWMLGHAGWYSLQPYQDIMFYVPFQQLFLIGPIFFFYTQSLLNPSFRFTRRAFFHLVPALLYALYSLVIWTIDKLILHEYYFYANGRDKDLDVWYQQLGWLSMVIYAVFSIRYYYAYKKIIFKVLSFAHSVQFDWIKKYLLAFIFMQVLRGIFLFLYPNWGSFTQKWWYYFLFSLLFYYIGFTGYVNTIKSVLSFKFSLLYPSAVYLLGSDAENTRQRDISVSPIESMETENDEKNSLIWDQLKASILNLIQIEKIHQNPGLTLADIATRLETNPTTVSRVVTHCFGMNFNDFINHYRVEAVIEMIKEGMHQKQTLLGIAYTCGFNSKTTFNRVFKNNTGISPKEFVEKLAKP
ncbi:helix-turn-helix domain-containing protein [Haliscomenobacter hydrossis]|uniref:Transcriptional regulator, AraC family n=1 Tax=Haliscomenobacter hydrossis (strain ATCC 27775 / DSM 1100 / LMG 10767 / O) TaxID=760192 RepID=F4L5K3_HALH1|nr:AraC family transcriptional regulator [Haliscomenobacter hydrossis]AEE51838.1 transcriptional regulator, AraC family [Haliscomenobacter hydrossis DSM 1100]